jgi:hypothetical protein
LRKRQAYGRSAVIFPGRSPDLPREAQFLGARVGAALAIGNGARLIKPLLVVICLALAARLLIDPAHLLRLMFGV